MGHEARTTRRLDSRDLTQRALSGNPDGQMTNKKRNDPDGTSIFVTTFRYISFIGFLYNNQNYKFAFLVRIEVDRSGKKVACNQLLVPATTRKESVGSPEQ